MKKIISVVSVVVFTLAVVGAAFADEMPWHKTFEDGAYIGGRLLTDDAIAMSRVTGAAPGGVREDVLEKSTAVVESLFGRSISPDQPDPYLGFLKRETTGMKGAAPGGVREDVLEKSKIVHDSLFGATIAVDNPDPYRGF
jgi:hypothetical protein